MKFAFYDFDGTLARSNVVERYAWFARRHPSRIRALARTLRMFASIPYWLALDAYSRRLFNERFFLEYRGLDEAWMREQKDAIFEQVILPKIQPRALAAVEADRAAGFEPVLVTGELDIALEGVVRYFRFAHVIANRMLFERGKATGKVDAPLIAEGEKVAAIERLCRTHGVSLADCKAYSDSISDRPMLEAVGFAHAVNPERRLRALARERGWPILDWSPDGRESRSRV